MPSLLLCRSDGAPPRVLGDRQLVVGADRRGSHRVAFFSKRPDRAGMDLNVYDRELDEFMLNPGAEAFLPVFGPGFRLWPTRPDGIACKTGRPTELLMKHLPDRRFAWGYWFTRAQHVILEYGADRQGHQALRRVLSMIRRGSRPSSMRRAMEQGASRVTFLPSGNSALVVVPQGDSAAPDGVYLLDVEAGTAISARERWSMPSPLHPGAPWRWPCRRPQSEEAEIDILVLDVSAHTKPVAHGAWHTFR